MKNDLVHITYLHHSEWQKYLLFCNVIMFTHEFSNILRWFECMSIFDSCTCQAAWMGAHLLDIFTIWFRKPLKEPPDIIFSKKASDIEKSAFSFGNKPPSVPTSESLVTEVDDKGCPTP